MLITTCTHCLARFRVTPQQLNARQGQVRCGRCEKVFSGFEALERVPDDDTGSRLLAAREALERAAPRPSETPGEELPELEGMDAPAPIAAGEPPVPARPASRGTRRQEPVPPAAIAEPFDLEPPARRVSRAWSLGVFVLLVALGVEAAYAFRAPLALHYPALRPWLESACAQAGCVVPWPQDERLLKLQESELLEVPGRPGEISLAARIRNLAPVAQAYPHLELTLTDIGGQPAARRVLKPADYLGHRPARDEVLAAGGEIAIQLRLALTGLKATGYELLVFYP
ncbi:MAG TPA: zinc-ribbon and DUF3426 domain-containing protein [Usitatibacter sp.]|jgi:predicted Zn finger-like uncharacterized protein|nr:zinc-ribbon and DUF3426 domain-containing protein [Usitatibacter sp.]